MRRDSQRLFALDELRFLQLFSFLFRLGPNGGRVSTLGGHFLLLALFLLSLIEPGVGFSFSDQDARR